MKVLVVTVGRPRGTLVPGIEEYERRARRYLPLELAEVRAVPATRGRAPGQVMDEEGARLLARVPAGFELVALERTGPAWSSEHLADYLAALGLRSAPGAAFVLGGAFGLSPTVLQKSTHQLSLSSLTFPHELARLLLAEQLYRAGTILRGEPYHKGPAG